MRLYKTIKELVDIIGIRIIVAKPFVNILDDIGAFREEPVASKKVMRCLLEDGFGEQLVRISEQKEVNWQNPLRKSINDYALKSGYKDELINSLATQLLYAVGILNEMPQGFIPQSESVSNCEATNIDDYKALIVSYFVFIDINVPKTVPVGEPFTMRWTSSGATQVSISGIGAVDLAGQQDVTLSESSDFTFVLTSATGLKTEKSVYVKVAKRGVINCFNAERTYTFSSVPVRISWDCSNMTSVELMGYGKQPATGSLEVEISRDKTFELRAKDHFNKFSNKIKVCVLPYPSIKTIRVPQFEEVEYTNSVTINNTHIDIRPLVSKVNVSSSFNTTLGALSVNNPKIELPNSLIVFSDGIKETMRNLFRITSKSYLQIVNQVKQAINERD